MSGLWILLVPLMSPNRELFYNLDKLECGSVFMGNDQTCEILGMGKIKLKLHDGIVRFLNEVRYVPDLKKKSHLSWFLESKGFNIIIGNGTLNVLYGSLVVMMGTRQRNMSFIKGSTVIGGATTVSDIIGEVDSYTSRLLGHAGENDLHGLVKQDLLKGINTYKLEFHEHCILESKLKSRLAQEFIKQ